MVTEQLASGRDGGQVNNYWLVKNMMGILMDDMLKNWNSAKDTILATRAALIELDEKLGGLEASFAWKYYAMCRRTSGASSKESGAGRGKEAGISAGQASPTCTGKDKPVFPIPSTMGPLHSKCTWKEDRGDTSLQCNSDPLPVKLRPTAGEATTPGPCRLSTEEPVNEFYGGFPILEETPDTTHATADTQAGHAGI